MRPLAFVVPVLLAAAVAGCKQKENVAEARSVRTIVVEPQRDADAHQAVGEVKPRYESELSFRVSGKLFTRTVDVGATVKRDDLLARLDTQDYENRRLTAVAEVALAEAVLVEAQAAEARQAKLLRAGWTPRAAYDTVLSKLRTAEAKLASGKANLDLAKDQLKYTELKAEFDGVVTGIGAEAGQNVSAGQMVVKLARPTQKDGVFTMAESTIIDQRATKDAAFSGWLLANPRFKLEGAVREISPVADPTTRTYTVKVTLNDPPPQVQFGMTIAGRWSSKSEAVVVLPLSAIFDKNGSTAVWRFDPHSGSVNLQPVNVARYESDTAVIAGGLDRGNVVVVAGINALREGQLVKIAETSAAQSAVR